ncbi:hypothetical protein AVEN_203645-1 [Araneus ventricosus]|uniref:Uncharacterized protein n=1 Tax=Araneus ventricosus TaxID=182803 RepID=A0A4Y2JB48_ARAVE|nr:hypothetical protein AVEN_203645-1 [Araneus ventricosus]
MPITSDQNARTKNRYDSLFVFLPGFLFLDDDDVEWEGEFGQEALVNLPIGSNFFYYLFSRFPFHLADTLSRWSFYTVSIFLCKRMVLDVFVGTVNGSE